MLPLLGAFWLFVVGSSLGSFLNVVAYRWPRGESLWHPPSRCRNCQNPISFRDNVPVLGWLVLRGRCRNCQAPISGRYPLIELIAGLLVVYAGCLSWYLCKGNAPVRGFEDIPWLAVGRFACHAAVLLTLLTMCLLSETSADVKPLAVLVGFVLLVLTVVWPELRLGRAWLWGEAEVGTGWIAGSTGLLVGIGLGYFAGLLWKTPSILPAWALVGIAVGPSLTLGVFIIHLLGWSYWRWRNVVLTNLPVLAHATVMAAVLIQLSVAALS